jgi:hypothetical protein
VCKVVPLLYFMSGILIYLQVRDRATLYLNTLGGDGSIVETDKAVKDFLFGPFDIPLVNLETSLKNYVSLGVFLAFRSYSTISHVFVMIAGAFRRGF